VAPLSSDETWPERIEPAMRQAVGQTLSWDATFDVVVVGYGGAGVCAALEARTATCSVLALDRFAGGGATRINGGVLYAGGGTHIQKAAGVEDSVEAMTAYLRLETQGVVSDATLQRFCAQSSAQLEWLEGHGVPFNARLYAKKTSYPPSDYYLYHSDSSLSGRYAAAAKPAARGHRVYMPAANRADGYGAGIFDPLRQSARALGVVDWDFADARALITDAQGAVIGVKVVRLTPDHRLAPRHRKLVTASQRWLSFLPGTFPGAALAAAHGRSLAAKAQAIETAHADVLHVRARRGVVLSAGGFVFNRAMVGRHAPKYVAGMPLGAPGDDGAGVALGASVGAAMRGLDKISAWRFINPPTAWSRGMLVDAQGERFIDETLYGAAIGQAMCEAQGGKAYLILDRLLIAEAKRELAQKGVLPFQKYPALLAMAFGAKKAKTQPALAARCGFDPKVLAATFAAYGALARGEADDPFGKRSSDAAVLGEGPYVVVDMSIDAPLAPLPTLTLGGLVVDEDCGQVLSGQGGAIPGLYAAGRTAIGVCSNLYVSGLAMADCVFSGRRAGAAVASRGGGDGNAS
jgi:3-oxo-5alpha-steroid 4-dehydrogenase